MAEVVYILCAIASVACATLLLKAYRRTQTALLFWSSLGFGAFALNNILLVVDKVFLPVTVDLLYLRTSVMLVGFGLLLFGLIWERDLR